MKHSQARAYKLDRQRDALERNEKWAKLSAAEKLAALDKRLGKGVGAKRQRAKLAS